MPVNEFQFAEAFTTVTVRGKGEFDNTIDAASKSLEKLQTQFAGVARHARRMLLVGGGALGLFVKMAADAEEIASKFNAVFRDNADAARDWADNLAKGVGRFRLDLEETMSSFQGFFVGLGFGQDEAMKLSQQMQALSVDFASFNNLADAEAGERFISALSGSSEVLAMFGINIKQAALQQELLAMGITKSITKATEQEKALARVNVIMRAMGEQGAIGDARRTAGSLANQFKALASESKAMAVAIGEAVVPVVRDVIAAIRELSLETGKFTDAQKNSIAQWLLFGTTALGILAILPELIAGIRGLVIAVNLLGGTTLMGGALGVLITALGLAASAFVTAKLRGKEFGETVLELAADIGLMSDAWERWKGIQAERGGEKGGMTQTELDIIDRESREFNEQRDKDIVAGITTAEAAGKAEVEANQKVKKARGDLADEEATLKEAVEARRKAEAALQAPVPEPEEVRAPQDQAWWRRGFPEQARRQPLHDPEEIRQEQGVALGKARADERKASEALAKIVPELARRTAEAFEKGAEAFRQKGQVAREEEAVERLNRERRIEEIQFGRQMLEGAEEERAIQAMNDLREAQERGFGAEMLAVKPKPTEVTSMAISQVAAFMQQQLAAQKPTEGERLIAKAQDTTNTKMDKLIASVDTLNVGWA